MDNLLPEKVDLVIYGTGVVESIVSAAASRIGKTVLHLDSKPYYGGHWASFNLKTINQLNTSFVSNPKSNEYVALGNGKFDLRDFEVEWHIVEKNNEEHTGDAPEPHSQESLLRLSAKFNIDLVPKLHLCRGDYVELLISSNIARYSEFRSVSRILTYLNGELQVVPCSRSDVFSNDRISVIEKRMLMKLLTSLDDILEEFKDESTTTFHTFLQSKNLSPNLIHFILYAMAFSTPSTPLNEGLSNTKRFVQSLGRFGTTPFLYSMYGSGETCQAFCRLSAVFGGVYALGVQPKGLEIEGDKVKCILNENQKIEADNFVLGLDKAPQEIVERLEVTNWLSRGIFLTDKSLVESEQEHLSLLVYPDEGRLIRVLEMGALTGTCPKGLFLVHLTAKQIRTPKEDFVGLKSTLFGEKGPNVLWSCYFSIPETDLDLKVDLGNLFLCSGPDFDYDYDASIKKAKVIFEKMYPDLEFLPRAPNPEEIVFGDDTESQSTE